VGPELVPLVLVQGSLQQRSEDRRLDLAPMLLAGIDQQAKLMNGGLCSEAGRLRT